MLATRTDLKAKAHTRTQQLRWRAEGRAAYQGRLTTPAPPYAPNTQAWDQWLHGWWAMYYGFYCLFCDGKHHVLACPEVRALLFADPPDVEGPADLGGDGDGDGSPPDRPRSN